MSLLATIAKRHKQAVIVAESKQLKPTFRGAALYLNSTELARLPFEYVLSGPAETGKTFSGLWFVHRFLRMFPNARGLLARKTQKSIYNSVLPTYRKIATDARPYGGKKPEWFTYVNGSELIIAGLDNTDRILSAEYDIIYVPQAEELELAEWETLTTRATGRAANAPYSFILGDCNPSNSTHWLLNRKSLILATTTHKDNPSLYDNDGVITQRGERSLQILNNLTGVRKLRLADGKWSNVEGAIYATFSKGLHTVQYFTPPDSWLKIRSIDFGYTNPLVVQWYAIDHDGRMYLYRELYYTQQLVQDVCTRIQQVEAWFYITPGGQLADNPNRELIYATVADHDAEDRATLYRYGIETIPAYKGVTLGIEAVQLRLRVQPDGKPRLMFMNDVNISPSLDELGDDMLPELDQELVDKHKPTNTVAEFDTYIWSKTKEAPMKADDHGLDALRYAVCFVDAVGIELEDTSEIIIYEDTLTISVY